MHTSYKSCHTSTNRSAARAKCQAWHVTGQHAFLSNFFPSPIPCECEGDHPTLGLAPTVEHAFQAAKTTDPQEVQRVLDAPTPAAAKARGKKVKLRADWNTARVAIMKTLLCRKFQNPELRAQLLATGDAQLVEGNRWNDRFWGVCKGTGQNQLGKLLMQVRDEIRAAV